MARTMIRNLNVTPVTIPLPYAGVLKQGSGCVVSDSEATVIANLGGQEAVRNVFDIFPCPASTPLGPFSIAASGSQVLAALAAAGATVVSGLLRKDPCVYATAVALDACTVSVDKKTLTADANGQLTVDGHGMVAGDVTAGMRILVKNQVADQNNGIYVLMAPGVGGVSKWVLTRAADANAASLLALYSWTSVLLGTANKGLEFYISTAPAAMGTNTVAFTLVDTLVTLTDPTHAHGGTTGSTTATDTAEVRTGTAVFEAPIAAELITIAADAACADGAVILTAGAIAKTAPDYPRGLALRVTIAVNPITAGAATVLGKMDGRAVTEEVSLITAVSATIDTVKAYSEITSITVHDLVGGGGAGDNLSVGVSALLGLPASGTFSAGAFTGIAEYNSAGVAAALARVAVGTVSAANGTWSPTNAPNAARCHRLDYTYSVTTTQAGHTHTIAAGATGITLAQP